MANSKSEIDAYQCLKVFECTFQPDIFAALITTRTLSDDEKPPRAVQRLADEPASKHENNKHFLKDTYFRSQ